MDVDVGVAPRVDVGVNADADASLDVDVHMDVYVCVDEYQDVNDLQAKMLQSLTSHHRNLLAIGDRAQAIYGFRGANVNHFDNFSAQFSGASIFHLTHNFRSTATIVRASELLFQDASDSGMRSVEAVRGDGMPVQLVGCIDAESEARFIAREFSSRACTCTLGWINLETRSVVPGNNDERRYS